MRLYAFPVLVQGDILTKIDPSALVILSLCSIKTNNKIKVLRSAKSQLTVTPMTPKHNTLDFKITVVTGKLKSQTLSLYAADQPMLPSVYKFGDLEIPCKFSYTAAANTTTITLDFHQNKTIQILSYLCDLFRTSNENIIYTFINDFDCVPYIPVGTIRNSIIYGEHFTPHNLHDFYATNPNQNFSMIVNKCGFGWLDRPYTTRNLAMLDMTDTDTPMLYGFKGENALLKSSRFDDGYAQRFVSSWIEKSNDNLKSMIICREGFTFRQVIPTNVKPEKVVRPQHYPYDSIIRDCHVFPDASFDCADGVDIKRDTDGKRATIKTIGGYFFFFVWS